jgi:hypothetical protein
MFSLGFQPKTTSLNFWVWGDDINDIREVQITEVFTIPQLKIAIRGALSINETTTLKLWQVNLASGELPTLKEAANPGAISGAKTLSMGRVGGLFGSVSEDKLHLIVELACDRKVDDKISKPIVVSRV